MDDLLGPVACRAYVAACAVHDDRERVTIENVQKRLPDDDKTDVLEAMYELAEKGLLRMEWKPLYRVEWASRPKTFHDGEATSYAVQGIREQRP